MPSALVFTAVAGGVYVTGTFESGVTGVLLPQGDYQLMQMNATELWLKPLNGGYNIGEFTHANVTTPVTANLAALLAQLQAMLGAGGTLPSGAATSAKQDELAALIGPGDGSVAQSTNGLLLAVVTSVLEQEIFLPKSDTAPQLAAQGETTGYIDVEGSKSGSFNWMFTLGAGTNGTGILYGNNDGVNAAFDVEIQSTGSQTADAAGVISWTLPWKYIKFDFDIQTGAGSTFDGSIYAL